MSSQTDNSDLYFVQLAVGPMGNLAYLVGSLSARECLIVDPAWNIDGLLEQTEQDDMAVVGVLATHYHQDHVGGTFQGQHIEGVDQLLARRPVPVHINRNDVEGLTRITGVSDSQLAVHEGGDVIELGAVRVRLLHTPGHTAGSQCCLAEEAGKPAHLVSGDTLFVDSCGRVDLPDSDPEAMYASLCDLKELPDDTLVFPGHLSSPEACSTIGAQKRSNPFLRATSREMFLSFMGY
jgi:glyoxylase-like metal-dependent hydrolase (beta-lactamase superfamily II)